MNCLLSKSSIVLCLGQGKTYAIILPISTTMVAYVLDLLQAKMPPTLSFSGMYQQ